MNNDQLYDHLQKISPLSSGLTAYLDVALKDIRFEKNLIIPEVFFVENPLVFIQSGTIKTQIDGLREPGQHLVRFHFEHSIVPGVGELDKNEYLKTTTTVEACLLKTLPIKHEYNLYKFFPEFHQLTGRMHQNQMVDLLMYIFHLRFEEGNQRLSNLLKIQPKLFQIASINDISAAVGVHPHTLSTYRKS